MAAGRGQSEDQHLQLRGQVPGLRRGEVKNRVFATSPPKDDPHNNRCGSETLVGTATASPKKLQKTT